MRKLRKACSNCNKRNGDSQFFVSQKMFIKILQLVEKCFRWQCLVLVKRKSFSTKMAKDVIFTKNCWKIFLNRKMEEVTNFLEPRNVEDIWNWYHTPDYTIDYLKSILSHKQKHMCHLFRKTCHLVWTVLLVR